MACLGGCKISAGPKGADMQAFNTSVGYSLRPESHEKSRMVQRQRHKYVEANSRHKTPQSTRPKRISDSQYFAPTVAHLGSISEG